MPDDPRASNTDSSTDSKTGAQTRAAAPARRRASAWLGFILVAGIGLLLLSRFGIDLPAGARPGFVRLVEEPGARQDPASPQLRLEGDLDGVLAVRPGDVVHVDASQIPSTGDVEIEVDLVEASSDAEARPVRLYRNGRLLSELRTRPLEGDRTRARLAIPAATFGEPAKYLVEVVTTERSHFPVRRYAIEVH